MAKRIKDFFKKLSGKLTLNTDKYLNKIKKVARSQKSDSSKKYSILSRRICFGIIITIILSYTAFIIMAGEEEEYIKNAGYTPSENTILKIQVVELEQKITQLEKELQKYKDLYGELEKDEQTQ